MLYDPKWEQKTDPHSLDAFIAWLEQQPASGAYDECDPLNCAIGQWLRATGMPEHLIEYKSLDLGNHPTIGNAAITNHTFGGALARARKLAAAS